MKRGIFTMSYPLSLVVLFYEISGIKHFIIVRCCRPSTQTCIVQRNPKSTKTNFFQNLLKPNKTENAYFISKIICLLKLLILMNSKNKIINIL